MEIVKIALSFVILGLATCSADKCDAHEMGLAILSCTTSTSMASSVQTAGGDLGKRCSALRTRKSCFTDATSGCNSVAASILNLQVLAQFKDLEKQCSGYSHASSTSVAY